jgi:hypothetical protein
MFAATSPASAAAPAVAPWQHLDIPHRMARVISTARLNFGEDRVTERDFARAVETCDLSKDELEANLGAAARLLISEAPEPTYSRAERVAHGAAAILGMLPSRADLEGRLALYHFPKSEIADLWAEIIAKAADDFHAQVGQPLSPADPGQWARDMLSKNAE